MLATYYHLFGIISAACYIFPIYGIILQHKRIIKRKSTSTEPGFPSDNISLNRTFASYVAFFANFTLGLSFYHLDWYLVLSRLIAILILICTLYEIKADRKDNPSKAINLISLVMFFSTACIALFERSILVTLLPLVQYFVVVAALLLVQGYVHQIYLLIRKERIGALSKRMFQFFLIKEVSTILFALTLNTEESWPLLFMHGSILLCECIILLLITRYETRNTANSDS